MNVRTEIEHMASQLFEPRREEFHKKRIAFYKAQDWRNWQETLTNEMR
jgi:hypothetical protein